MTNQSPFRRRVVKLINLANPAGDFLNGNVEHKKKDTAAQIDQKHAARQVIISPIFKKDIFLSQTRRKHHTFAKYAKSNPPYTLNWVSPAFSPASGGISDIFRTISYLESKGHTCRVYIYDINAMSSLGEQRGLIKKYNPKLRAEVSYNSPALKKADATFATNLTSAYTVKNSSNTGKRYYYVQDFEPYFMPPGAMSLLAEDTYKFGFKGITLGGWLAEKLRLEYDMECEYFDFGYDPDDYFVRPGDRQAEILFYAQPEKARRGFELGILALELFHTKNPKIAIHLFGSDSIGNFDIPFPNINHGVLSIERINDLYNKCKAGLVLSFTNLSLIPLEMLAAGCVPVINDSVHTRMIKYGESLEYAEPKAEAIALTLEKTLRKKEHTIDLSNDYNWENSNEQIHKMLVSDLSI